MPDRAAVTIPIAMPIPVCLTARDDLVEHLPAGRKMRTFAFSEEISLESMWAARYRLGYAWERLATCRADLRVYVFSIQSTPGGAPSIRAEERGSRDRTCIGRADARQNANVRRGCTRRSSRFPFGLRGPGLAANGWFAVVPRWCAPRYRGFGDALVAVRQGCLMSGNLPSTGV
jgi:hypothetical protein